MATKPRTTTSKPKTTTTAGTRATRAASKTVSQLPTPPSSQPDAKTTRKPFVSRENSSERVLLGGSQNKILSKTSTLADFEDDDKEPIQAFLRIRPYLGGEPPSNNPYLESISSTAVRMSDPSSSTSPPVHSRLSTAIASMPSIYTFSHIFPPETSQPDFFARTTLPLVKSVLEGQSGLLFTYGVTNSGKTYTIQGGNGKGKAGILPRTLDVLFNSIEGLHGDGKFQPIRLQGIELAPTPSLPLAPTKSTKHRPSTLADVLPISLADDNVSLDIPSDTDPTTIKLDRNHEYTIWLSYVEVYNEKVYDLFATIDDPTLQSSTSGSTSRPNSSFLSMPIPNTSSNPLVITRKALSLKPCPPSDSPDSDAGSSGKYIAGLRQIRVTSAAQAKELLRIGQMHRQVFGTLANAQSSRSHALVTVKVLKVHRGEKNDPTSIQTSRLTLVDLAGSERTKNTQTTGDRLREAGSINKSLMVLGQCLETMRSNQRALARSLSTSIKNQNTVLDTRDVKRSLAVVPFRHSKLTEVLMDYFVGDSSGGGRAVMIVNVNPYDTTFEENAHVMKFAALAREVVTSVGVAAARAVPVPPQSNLPVPKRGAGAGARASEAVPHRRKVTISTGGPGQNNETVLEVLEEDEEPNDQDDDDDEPINPLVDALFDEIEALRIQLFETEMRCAIIEADTREEVMLEMEDRMQAMEKMYTRRLMKEIEHSDARVDAKLDMLQRSGMLGKGAVPRLQQSGEDDSEELEDIEEEVSEEEDEEEDEIETSLIYEGTEGTESDIDESEEPRDRSPSPLASKTRAKSSSIGPTSSSTLRLVTEKTKTRSDLSSNSHHALDDTEEEEDTGHSVPPGSWDPKSPSLPRPGVHSSSIHLTQAPSPVFETEVKAARKKSAFGDLTSHPPSQSIYPSITELMQSRDKPPAENAKTKGKSTASAQVKAKRSSREGSLTKLVEKTSALDLGEDDEVAMEDDVVGCDDSVVIVPNRQVRKNVIASAGPEAEYVPQKGEADTTKKKKRQLSKKPVMTEEDVEKAVAAAEVSDGKQLRRSIRGHRQ